MNNVIKRSAIVRVIATLTGQSYTDGIVMSEDIARRAMYGLIDKIASIMMIVCAAVATLMSGYEYGLVMMIIAIILYVMGLHKESTMMAIIASSNSKIVVLLAMMRYVIMLVPNRIGISSKMSNALEKIIFGTIGLYKLSATHDSELCVEWEKFSEKHNWIIRKNIILEDDIKTNIQNLNTNNRARIIIGKLRKDELATNYEGFTLSKYMILPEYVLLETDNCSYSRMDKIMLAKAIDKRILGGVKQIDRYTLKKIYKKLIDIYGNMNKPLKYCKDEREAVIKALSTEGTIGKFLRRTLLETNFKDKQNEQSIEIMVELVKEMKDMSWDKQQFLSKELPYELYMKVEVVEGKDDNIKITRLMQASHFIYRCADNMCLDILNQSIKDKGYEQQIVVGTDPIKIVLYIFGMKNGDEEIYVVSGDIENFDGSQHPYLMVACRNARLKHMMNTKINECYAKYMIERYETEIVRLVNIRQIGVIEVIGVQPSGSTTTTDDNSMRTASIMIYMLEDELKMTYTNNVSEQNEYQLSIAGDNITVIVKGKENAENIRSKMVDVFGRCGMKFKEEFVESLRYDMPTMLGFNVMQIETMDNTTGVKHELSVIVRKEKRAVYKLVMAAEWDKGYNEQNRTKQASKSITSIMLQPFDIANMMLNFIILMRITSRNIDMENRKYLTYVIRESGMAISNMTIMTMIWNQYIVRDLNFTVKYKNNLIAERVKSIFSLTENIMIDEFKKIVSIAEDSSITYNIGDVITVAYRMISEEAYKRVGRDYDEEEYKRLFSIEANIKERVDEKYVLTTKCEHISKNEMTTIKNTIICCEKCRENIKIREKYRMIIEKRNG